MSSLLFLFLSIQSFADTTHTNGYWAGLFTNTAISDSTSIHQEFQLRKNTETGLTAQSLFRAGPLWKYNEQLSLGVLYAFVRTGPSSEHRLTQQITYKATDALSFRTRIEQRTLEKQNGVSLRARLLGRYQYAWSNSLSFVFWDEYFYQATTPTWVYDSYFDRNRFFLGFRSQWNKINLEYGYMNQYANRAGSDLSEHLFLIYLIL